MATPTSSAPVEIDHVALTVRDLDKVSAYYQRALGLASLSLDGETERLGAGDKVLLELRRDTAARVHDPREAGLFHTAFLVPSRADLSRWLVHAMETREPVQGASDHLVSEAIYLADPEGNGIEIYVDRPRAQWNRSADGIKMATEPLDIQGLAQAGSGTWGGMPAGSVIGHVHLQVGNLGQTDAFYRDVLGLDLTNRYPGANFWSWGGYHHHLGTNIWNSRNAGQRSEGMAGLAEVVLAADAAEAARLESRFAGAAAADPWGTRFRVVEKAA